MLLCVSQENSARDGRDPLGGRQPSVPAIVLPPFPFSSSTSLFHWSRTFHQGQLVQRDSCVRWNIILSRAVENFLRPFQQVPRRRQEGWSSAWSMLFGINETEIGCPAQFSLELPDCCQKIAKHVSTFPTFQICFLKISGRNCSRISPVMPLDACNTSHMHSEVSGSNSDITGCLEKL